MSYRVRASCFVRAGNLLMAAVMCCHMTAHPGFENPQTTAAAAYADAEGLRRRGEATSLRQAIEKYQSAVALYREGADQRGESDALYGLGRTLDALGQKRKALDTYLAALPIYRALALKSGEANTLIYMALDYAFLAEGAKARSAASDALAAGQDAGPGLAAILFTHAAEVMDQLADRQKALEYYGQALPLHKAAGNRRGEASVLQGTGVVYYAMGQPRKALEYLEPALELQRAMHGLRDEGFVLSTMGVVYLSMDDYPRALTYCEQALPVLEKAGDRPSVSATLHNTAVIYERIGQLEKAIEYYERALPIHRETGYRVGEANTFANIGKLHLALGDTAAALDYYNRALPLHRASGNPGLEGVTLHSLGMVYEAMGDPKKALDYFSQALPLRRAASDRVGEADTLDRMSRVYASLGDRPKALEMGTQALEMRRALGNPRAEAISLNTLGMIHAAAGDYPQSEELFSQALGIFRSLADRLSIAPTLHLLAQSESRQNRLSEARAHVDEALGIVESLRVRISSPELRTSYFAAVRDYFDLEIDLLMRLDKQQPSAGLRAAAFEASERSRSRSLLELLTESRVDIREGIDPALLDRERMLKQTLNAKADRQMALLRGKRPAAELDAASAEIARLTDDYRRLEAEIRTASPHYAALTHPQPLDLGTVQREMLDANTLLLQYSLGAERSYAWLISQSGMEAFVLRPRREIEGAARRFYETASSEEGNGTAAARALSDLILGPMAGRLGSKRLAVVADGALEYVPFAALPEPGAAAGRPLLAAHEIVNLPSCSTLRALRTETAGRQPAPKMLAVMADPVFRKDDSRVRNQAVAAASDVPARTGMRTAELNLARLTGSRQEAQTILAMAPETRRRQALDFDASLAGVTDREMGQYRIVHLATHAFLDTEHPELSSIVLSLVDREGRPQDGILRLHDIYNLRWQADLVVLSACQTALGREVRSEGLIGLARGFMYAGVPRVSASLWKVDDRATAELMKHFYSAMLGPKSLPPAAALRAAQIQMLATKQWQAPYYWAAFVLRGDWR
jgi:CHAT domain-containing protein/tetratricopeptide (TPR) repeat protein